MNDPVAKKQQEDEMLSDNIANKRIQMGIMIKTVNDARDSMNKILNNYRGIVNSLADQFEKDIQAMEDALLQASDIAKPEIPT